MKETLSHRKCHVGCCSVTTMMNQRSLLQVLDLSMGSPHSPPYTDTSTAWLEEDIKPPRSLLGLPGLSWPGVYLPCCDRLDIEENPWVLRVTEGPAPAALPSRTLEPSPAQDPTSVMEGAQVEERCLEQVQTMVVGEVLKDVDTACKLLNIASGRGLLAEVVCSPIKTVPTLCKCFC